MKPEVETNILPLIKEKNMIGDDRYLSDVTRRLRELQALAGEMDDRKGRPKRWLGRVESSDKT